jgi:hypothetical protein
LTADLAAVVADFAADVALVLASDALFFAWLRFRVAAAFLAAADRWVFVC